MYIFNIYKKYICMTKINNLTISLNKWMNNIDYYDGKTIAHTKYFIFRSGIFDDCLCVNT